MRTSVLLAAAILVGCGQQGAEAPESRQAAAPAPLIQYEAPAPLAVPATKKAASEEDWPAIVHNKEVEVIKVLNVINPVAATVVAGFEQYGERFSEVTQEEWHDTQVQLGKALVGQNAEQYLNILPASLSPRNFEDSGMVGGAISSRGLLLFRQGCGELSRRLSGTPLNTTGVNPE